MSEKNKKNNNSESCHQNLSCAIYCCVL